MGRVFLRVQASQRGKGEGETSEAATEGPAWVTEPRKGQDKQSPRGKEGKQKGRCVCDSLLGSVLRSTRRGTDGHRDSLHQHLRETGGTHTHRHTRTHQETGDRAERKALGKGLKTKRGRAQLRPERRKPGEARARGTAEAPRT